MFIPTWFLILVVILGALHLAARFYLNKFISHKLAEKTTKCIGDFEISFTIFGKDGKFYRKGNEKAVFKYPVNEDSSNS